MLRVHEQPDQHRHHRQREAGGRDHVRPQRSDVEDEEQQHPGERQEHRDDRHRAVVAVQTQPQQRGRDSQRAERSPLHEVDREQHEPDEKRQAADVVGGEPRMNQMGGREHRQDAGEKREPFAPEQSSSDEIGQAHVDGEEHDAGETRRELGDRREHERHDPRVDGNRRHPRKRMEEQRHPQAEQVAAGRQNRVGVERVDRFVVIDVHGRPVQIPPADQQRQAPEENRRHDRPVAARPARQVRHSRARLSAKTACERSG